MAPDSTDAAAWKPSLIAKVAGAQVGFQNWAEGGVNTLGLNLNVIVAFGNIPLIALTNRVGITKWRGSVLESTLVPGLKVLPTYHPQKVNYEWKLHFPAVMDLQKARLNSETPALPVDNRRLNSSPSKREFIDYLHYLYFDHKDPIAVDIETTQPGSNLLFIRK